MVLFKDLSFIFADPLCTGQKVLYIMVFLHDSRRELMRHPAASEQTDRFFDILNAEYIGVQADCLRVFFFPVFHIQASLLLQGL